MAETVTIEGVSFGTNVKSEGFRVCVTLTRAQVEEALKRLNEPVFKPGDLVERTGHAREHLLRRHFLVTNQTPNFPDHVTVTDGIKTHVWCIDYIRKVGTLLED